MAPKIRILPCNGDSPAGLVTWITAQELVLEGKAHWYSSISTDNGPAASGLVEPETFILVDGCDRQCLFNIFLDKGLVGEHNLALNDVGIEPTYMREIKRSDIDLAKDAVIAECTSVDTMQPILFSGCCCR